MKRFIKKVRAKCEKIASLLYAFLQLSVAIGRDHVKLWELGLTLALKVPSVLFLVPFTVNKDADGILVLRVRSKSADWVTYAVNALLGLRGAYVTRILVDQQLKLIINGKFTVDASFLIVCTFFGTGTFVVSSMMLLRKEDFLFLCNSAIRMNKTFSGSRKFFQLWAMLNFEIHILNYIFFSLWQTSCWVGGMWFMWEEA